MKAVVLADPHVCAERIEEHAALLKQARGCILGIRPDLVLVAGDLCGVTVPHRPHPSERNALCRFLVDIADVAPVLVVRGNHDPMAEHVFLGWLAGEHPVVYAEEPIFVDAGPAVVGLLPWIDASRVPAGDDWVGGVHQRWFEVLTAAKSELAMARADGKPVLLLAHAAVSGGRISEHNPVVGTTDPLLDLGTIMPKGTFDAGFFGHWHLPQELRGGSGPAWYVGSLWASQWGEPTERGFAVWDSDRPKALERHVLEQPARVVVDFDVRRDVVLDVRPLGACRIEAGMTSADVGAALVATKVEDRSRLVLRLPAEPTKDESEAVRALEAVLRRSFASVETKRERERVVRLRAGAEKVVAARGLEDALRSFAEHVDPRPEPVTVLRAVQLVSGMEAEA